MLKAYDGLFTKGDGRQAADELCTLSQTEGDGYPWRMQAASRLIVKYESEWANPSKWKPLIAELEKQTGPKPQYEEEQKRIERLAWWDEVKAGVPGFPEPSVFHIHPIGLIGNFIVKLRITVEMLKKVYASASDVHLAKMADLFNEDLVAYKLDTPLRLSHFFAQSVVEAGSRAKFVESLDYQVGDLSARTGLMQWSYFRNHVEEAKKYGRTSEHPANQEAIANRAYAGKNGNGDIESGDGWKFRGRGLKQLTGRGNYAEFSGGYEVIFGVKGADFEASPEEVGVNPLYAVRSAVFYWLRHELFEIADKGATDAVVREITVAVNGGETGLSARNSAFQDYWGSNIFEVGGVE
ncbi:putative chitinase [Burkholderia multivorans]